MMQKPCSGRVGVIFTRIYIKKVGIVIFNKKVFYKLALETEFNRGKVMCLKLFK